MTSAQQTAHLRMLQLLPSRVHVRKEIPRKNRFPKVTPQMVKEWRKLKKRGWMLREIASRYNVSTASVGNYLR